MTVRPSRDTPDMASTKTATETPEPGTMSGLDQVEAWRLECLLRAGWDAEHAEVIAVTHTADLHVACSLVEKQGCSVELAFAILS